MMTLYLDTICRDNIEKELWQFLIRLKKDFTGKMFYEIETKKMEEVWGDDPVKDWNHVQVDWEMALEHEGMNAFHDT